METFPFILTMSFQWFDGRASDGMRRLMPWNFPRPVSNFFLNSILTWFYGFSRMEKLKQLIRTLISHT
jgi:hypothetical protein